MPSTRRYKVRDASNRRPPQHPNPYTGQHTVNFPYNQTKQWANARSIIPPNKTLDLSLLKSQKSPQRKFIYSHIINVLHIAEC